MRPSQPCALITSVPGKSLGSYLSSKEHRDGESQAERAEQR